MELVPFVKVLALSISSCNVYVVMDVKDQMSFAQFLMKLSEQMLTFDPRRNDYAGDKKFRMSTWQQKRKRKSSEDLSVLEEIFPDTGVIMTNLRAA